MMFMYTTKTLRDVCQPPDLLYIIDSSPSLCLWVNAGRSDFIPFTIQRNIYNSGRSRDSHKKIEIEIRPESTPLHFHVHFQVQTE